MSTPTDIDHIAVERACEGDHTVRLNADEMAAAVAICDRRRMSDALAARLLGVTTRTIAHVRNGGDAPRLPRPMQPPARPGDVTFLTVAEVAWELRVSKMTIYRLIHAKELRAVQIGRSFRVPGKAIAEYLSGAAAE